MSGFSDFINSSPEEKEKVFNEVIDAACARQNASILAYGIGEPVEVLTWDGKWRAGKVSGYSRDFDYSTKYIVKGPMLEVITSAASMRKCNDA